MFLDYDGTLSPRTKSGLKYRRGQLSYITYFFYVRG
uniref:Uncharacterized protein n=1 Tax=Arundo donax TaxID=35708 RepID=A0A0A8YRN7_ARUDO